jgi:hypothetical protein
MNGSGVVYSSCSQILEKNAYFKQLSPQEQKLFINIVNEMIASSDVQVSFKDMSEARKNELMNILNSWCETSIQTGTNKSLERREEKLRFIIGKYFYLPVFSATPQNLLVLLNQKEQLKKDLFSYYEKQEISSKQHELIKYFINELILFFDNRINNDIIPVMKYPLSNDNFNDLLKSLPEQIGKIDFKKFTDQDDSHLKMEVIKIVSFVEQTYYQAIPQTVLDNVKNIQSKIEKFLPSEKIQKKLVEEQLAENMRQAKEQEKKFFEEANQRIAMIAQEENWNQLNNTSVELPTARITIFRIVLISIGVILILVGIFIKIYSYWSKNNNTPQ